MQLAPWQTPLGLTRQAAGSPANRQSYFPEMNGSVQSRAGGVFFLSMSVKSAQLQQSQRTEEKGVAYLCSMEPKNLFRTGKMSSPSDGPISAELAREALSNKRSER